MPPQWITDFLNAIGAPITSQNVAFLESWQTQEGPGTLNANNPFAITTPGGATWGGANGYFNSFSCSIGTCHVLQFPDMSTGITATNQWLNNGYTDVLAMLRSGDPQSYASSNPSVANNFASAWSYGLQKIFSGMGSASSVTPSPSPSPQSTTQPQQNLNILQCVNPLNIAQCWKQGWQTLQPQTGNTDFMTWLQESGILLGGIAFIFIGGLWIIFGNQDTRKVFIAKAKDALV